MMAHMPLWDNGSMSWIISLSLIKPSEYSVRYSCNPGYSGLEEATKMKVKDILSKVLDTTAPEYVWEEYLKHHEEARLYKGRFNPANSLLIDFIDE